MHEEYDLIKLPQNLMDYVDSRLLAFKNEASGNVESILNQRTIERYNKVWQRFLKNASLNINSKSLTPTLNQLVSDFERKVSQAKWKHSTYRQYRAIISFGLASTLLQRQNNQIPSEILDSDFTFEYLNDLYIRVIKAQMVYTNEYESTKIQKTSAMKKKSFPQPFYNWLQDYSPKVAKKKFPSRKPSYSSLNLVKAFVNANLLVGLRPIEWLDLSIASNIKRKCLCLIVKNAKNSHGRANGDFRYLYLENISDYNALTIFNFFNLFHSKLNEKVKLLNRKQNQFKSTESFQKQKEESLLSSILKDYEPSSFSGISLSSLVKKDVPQFALADLLLKTMQSELYRLYQIYIKHLSLPPDANKETVTLYSTRHQCIANAKKTKMQTNEMAAFFGHASIETASRHYGKAWNSWSSFGFRPSALSVANVNTPKNEQKLILKPEIQQEPSMKWDFD